jgi:hypothetical protein
VPDESGARGAAPPARHPRRRHPGASPTAPAPRRRDVDASTLSRPRLDNGTGPHHQGLDGAEHAPGALGPQRRSPRRRSRYRPEDPTPGGPVPLWGGPLLESEDDRGDQAAHQIRSLSFPEPARARRVSPHAVGRVGDQTTTHPRPDQTLSVTEPRPAREGRRDPDHPHRHQQHGHGGRLRYAFCERQGACSGPECGSGSRRASRASIHGHRRLPYRTDGHSAMVEAGTARRRPP